MDHTKRSLSVLLLVFLVAVGVAPDSLAKKPWEKIAIPPLNEIKMPEYQRVELENGMIVYLAEDHEFPLVELSATIDVGGIYEPDDKVGLASMTGSVMRSGGTTSRSLQVLKRGGFHATVTDAVAAAYERTQQLGAALEGQLVDDDGGDPA